MKFDFGEIPYENDYNIKWYVKMCYDVMYERGRSQEMWVDAHVKYSINI